jgi:hypothetical protein
MIQVDSSTECFLQEIPTLVQGNTNFDPPRPQSPKIAETLAPSTISRPNVQSNFEVDSVNALIWNGTV